MSDDIPDAEYDAIVEMLSDAGLVESYVTEDGVDGLRLTKRGEQVRRALAMAGDDDDAEVLGALAGGLRLSTHGQVSDPVRPDSTGPRRAAVRATPTSPARHAC